MFHKLYVYRRRSVNHKKKNFAVQLIESLCCTRKCCSNFHAVFYAHFSKNKCFFVCNCFRDSQFFCYFFTCATQLNTTQSRSIGLLLSLNFYFYSCIQPHTFPNNEKNSPILLLFIRFVSLVELTCGRCSLVSIAYNFFFCVLLLYSVSEVKWNNNNSIKKIIEQSSRTLFSNFYSEPN